MAKTAAQTVAYFESFNTHYWGPNNGSLKNQYNGKYYANPHTVAVGRATPTSVGEFWCADAVTHALMFAGIDIRKGCPGFCNCGSLYNYMLGQPASGLYGFKSVLLEDAQAGDITLLYFGGRWGHVFMHRAKNSGGNMLTVEGDTSNSTYPGSDTVGGVQCNRSRSVADWKGSTHTFRPTGYATATTTTTTGHADTGQDLNKYSSSTSVKHLQSILHVTQDGIAGPDTVNALEALAGYAKDGRLDPKGSNTLRKVQSRIDQEINAGLVVDGIWGPASAKAFDTYYAKGGRLTKLASQVTTAPKAKVTAPVAKLPAFPLPKGHAYAMNDGTVYTHSGVNKADQPNIKKIQAKVATTADGVYGTQTKAKVVKFQSSHGLSTDGQVGPQTWAALKL